MLFLHGWPQNWQSWRAVMRLAAPTRRAVALDLPGIGGSGGAPTDGSKRALAEVVRGVVDALGLDELTLVGHDIGGMVAYAYAREHAPARVVITDVALPGLDPWDAVLARPDLWRLRCTQCPGCPNR